MFSERTAFHRPNPLQFFPAVSCNRTLEALAGSDQFPSNSSGPYDC
jgi:hypothetical protein